MSVSCTSTGQGQRSSVWVTVDLTCVAHVPVVLFMSCRDAGPVMWLRVKDVHLMVWKCTREMLNNAVRLMLPWVCHTALATALLLLSGLWLLFSHCPSSPNTLLKIQCRVGHWNYVSTEVLWMASADASLSSLDLPQLYTTLRGRQCITRENRQGFSFVSLTLHWHVPWCR